MTLDQGRSGGDRTGADANAPAIAERAIVLFVEGRDRPENVAAVAMFEAARWSEGFPPRVVDVGRTQELAQWYGIRQFPAVAIVDDGMLVSIEHECSEAACRRLLEASAERAALLRRRPV